MTMSDDDVNARVARAAGLAGAGVIAGLLAYFLDVYTDAKQNFIAWSLITAAGGFYVSSIVTFVKALSLRGKASGESILSFGSVGLYILIHYSLAVFSTLLAVGVDSTQDLGGFALLMLVFALFNALGGFLGGIILGLLLYMDLTERGWNSLAAALAAGLIGLVEAAMCYVVQFNMGRWLLPNM